MICLLFDMPLILLVNIVCSIFTLRFMTQIDLFFLVPLSQVSMLYLFHSFFGLPLPCCRTALKWPWDHLVLRGLIDLAVCVAICLSDTLSNSSVEIRPFRVSISVGVSLGKFLFSYKIIHPNQVQICLHRVVERGVFFPFSYDSDFSLVISYFAFLLLFLDKVT